ncbi:hypothetical protein Droror1_Dr00021895 [Drosera rotundifolia]
MIMVIQYKARSLVIVFDRLHKILGYPCFWLSFNDVPVKERQKKLIDAGLDILGLVHIKQKKGTSIFLTWLEPSRMMVLMPILIFLFTQSNSMSFSTSFGCVGF